MVVWTVAVPKNSGPTLKSIINLASLTSLFCYKLLAMLRFNRPVPSERCFASLRPASEPLYSRILSLPKVRHITRQYIFRGCQFGFALCSSSCKFLKLQRRFPWSVSFVPLWGRFRNKPLPGARCWRTYVFVSELLQRAPACLVLRSSRDFTIGVLVPFLAQWMTTRARRGSGVRGAKKFCVAAAQCTFAMAADRRTSKVQKAIGNAVFLGHVSDLVGFQDAPQRWQGPAESCLLRAFSHSTLKTVPSKKISSPVRMGVGLCFRRFCLSKSV